MTASLDAWFIVIALLGFGAVYWIACPVGKRATALLGEWGLMPPPSEDMP